LLQPSSRSATPTKQMTTAIRRNIAHPSRYAAGYYGFKGGHFKLTAAQVPSRRSHFELVPTLIRGKETSFMQQQGQGGFDIEEAQRVLGDVFAP